MNNDNFVILDIETNVEDNASLIDHFHVIQIGATKITNGDFINYGGFNEYVRPVNIAGYPAGAQLTDFIKYLTKITQAQVDNARHFIDVWNDFLVFCAPYFEFFGSWGHYDWDVLKRVCEFYELPFPFRYHVDLKNYYKAYFNNEEVKRGFGVKEASKFFNLPYNEAGEHNGMEDAKMTTAIAKEMADKAFYTFRRTPHIQTENWEFTPTKGGKIFLNPVLVKKHKEYQEKARDINRLLFNMC